MSSYSCTHCIILIAWSLVSFKKNVILKDKLVSYCIYISGHDTKTWKTSKAKQPVFCLIPSFCRSVHLHWGEVPPGTSDGLLLNPDVHPFPSHCYPLMGLFLDKHGCCTSQSWSGHHHSTYNDHTELRFKSLFAQGESSAQKWVIYIYIYIY